MPIKARTLVTMTTPCSGTTGNDEPIGGDIVITGEENSERAVMKVGHYTIGLDAAGIADLRAVANRLLGDPFP